MLLKISLINIKNVHYHYLLVYFVRNNKKVLRNLKTKLSRDRNLENPLNYDDAFFENLAQSLINWIITNRFSQKRRDTVRDLERFELARPFLANFFKQSFETGWLQQTFNIVLIENRNFENINWASFPFQDFIDTCIDYLRRIQGTRNDYQDRRHMFSQHHIRPRFEGGDDSEENRVLLHRYEHALIHLLRWLCTDSRRDLGGFSSAMRTEENVLAAARVRAINPPRTAGINPPPPAPSARKKQAVTGRVIQYRRNLRERGLDPTTGHQRRTRVRADPFTWFVTTLPILFEFRTGLQYTHPGRTSDNLFDVSSAEIGRNLDNVRRYLPENERRPVYNLYKILSGIDQTCSGWRILHVLIKNQQYSIAQLREIYLIVFPVWENSPIPRPDRRILLKQIRVLLVEENLENQIIIATLIIDFLFERERLFSDEN